LTSNPSLPERVEPEVYTDDYYLTNCHGYEDFVISGGRKVGPRFVKALSLAGDLHGKRVLDVGCGRGELVIQSAMRGAEAWGIDYAQAAVDIAARALSSVDAPLRDRTHAEQMDVKALRFDDGFFDVVFMMDVVEHLYPQELALAFGELHRTMRPGGLLVMHTSPNKVFEEKVYPYYSRRINQGALWLSRRLKLSDGLLNETMLPTGREFPHDTFEREMHINEQSAPRLRAEVERHGFAVRGVEFWEPPAKSGYFPSRRLNLELAVLDFLRFLRPLSAHRPLNRLFCNHIWMTVVRL
jgi:SAM-dependent methyltransferase